MNSSKTATGVESGISLCQGIEKAMTLPKTLYVASLVPNRGRICYSDEDILTCAMPSAWEALTFDPANYPKDTIHCQFQAKQDVADGEHNYKSLTGCNI